MGRGSVFRNIVLVLRVVGSLVSLMYMLSSVASHLPTPEEELEAGRIRLDDDLTVDDRGRPGTTGAGECQRCTITVASWGSRAAADMEYLGKRDGIIERDEPKHTNEQLAEGQRATNR